MDNSNNHRFPLDETAIALISEIREQMIPHHQAIERGNAALSALLAYIMRANNLDGRWKLAENHRELVHQEEP